jgi:hypothetical protein
MWYPRFVSGFCNVGCHLYLRWLILFNCEVYGYHKITDWLLVNPNLTCLRPSKHGMFGSGHECIGLYSDILTPESSSQQFCHLFGDRFMGLLPFQLLVLYSEIVVSNELVAVGVTCGLLNLLSQHLPQKLQNCHPKFGLVTSNMKREFCLPTLYEYINPLNPELNPICYLLALLGAYHFLHVTRIRVKLLTFRLLMSYIYIYIWSTHSWCF